ncbi:dual specificity protein phosphatase-like protein [Acinetobacter calcoaceticus]|uniref:Dual specificity protein phosphatase-like protein n=1 Tax=Acinetobacter calcoaceticus TaxID=471 RepID=A0A4R1XXT8_ACICA|nr:dual specificity protein phosphatase-like protein [Acinetobacter calcoaceticus]
MIDKLTPQGGTWKWGLGCLLLLAPFFFLTYGFANQYAASLSQVPSIVFAWEHAIPLWPWSIVPYWSIDLFYGLSLLLCWNKFELKQHLLRLFSAQVIAVSCFLLFPLKFSFVRPELDGFFGLWFDILMGFDQPYNQAPSLHIVLLVILWDFYRRHSSGAWKWLVDFWSFLIGLSVLTTWQHHFIDIPAGLIVGALCLWLFPVQSKSPFIADHLHLRSAKHYKLASYYLIATILLTATALTLKSSALWLLYPAISLSLVALAYALQRPHFFQKQRNGKMTAASLMLMAPYFAFAWLNSRLWTLKHPEDSLVLQIQQTQIYLGRIPTASERQNYHQVFDCCAELPSPLDDLDRQYLSLDLIPLNTAQLSHAADQFNTLFLEQQQSVLDHENPEHSNNSVTNTNRKILIYCGLGYSRSSAILAAWMYQQQIVISVEEAIQKIETARPWVVIKPKQIEQIQSLNINLPRGASPCK